MNYGRGLATEYMERYLNAIAIEMMLWKNIDTAI
jgi:hypothetical protein